MAEARGIVKIIGFDPFPMCWVVLGRAGSEFGPTLLAPGWRRRGAIAGSLWASPRQAPAGLL